MCIRDRSYGAEKSGLLASLNSVAKLPYEYALDGISNTQTMAPSALGHDLDEQKTTLVRVMDGYFDRGAHHLNVNVFGTEKLLSLIHIYFPKRNGILNACFQNGAFLLQSYTEMIKVPVFLTGHRCVYENKKEN